MNYNGPPLPFTRTTGRLLPTNSGLKMTNGKKWRDLLEMRDLGILVERQGSSVEKGFHPV